MPGKTPDGIGVSEISPSTMLDSSAPVEEVFVWQSKRAHNNHFMLTGRVYPFVRSATTASYRSRLGPDKGKTSIRRSRRAVLQMRVC